jgi:hypothetical protein
MKKACKVLFFLFLIIIFLKSNIYSDVVWQKRSRGIDSVCSEISASKFKENVLLAGSKNILYKTSDKGKNWKRIKQFKSNEVIIDIKASLNKDAFFIVTNRAVYFLQDTKVKEIFKISNKNQKSVLCIGIDLIDFNIIYVGTTKGLWVSYNSGEKWKYLVETKNLSIYEIVAGIKVVIAGTNKGILMLNDKGKILSKIYDFSYQSLDEDNYIETDSDSGENIDFNIKDGVAFYNKSIKALFEKEQKLYFLTHKEFLVNYDYKGFKPFPISGLPVEDIFNIIYEVDLVAFSSKGIFIFDENSKLWKEVYNGLDTKIVYNGTYTVNGDLFCVSKKGIYVKELIKFKEINEDIITKLDENFEKEPSIKEVQKKAVEYAEVSKEKIDEWRSLVKKRALLPSVGMKYTRDIDETQSLSASSHTFIEGPMDEGSQWYITAAWDLKDLIWSDKQTSIDVRSKLMVQLREDILDEVTRLYFERRREQIDLIINNVEGREKIDKILRIRELTAGIDAFTNGWFSFEILKRQKLDKAF